MTAHATSHANTKHSPIRTILHHIAHTMRPNLATLVASVLMLTHMVQAKDFLDSRRFMAGIYATPGSMMGGGAEFGVSLYQGSLLQIHNIIAIESKAAKLLQDERFDSNISLLTEKLTFGILGGAQIASYAGFSFFQPYVFCSGGFGLMEMGGKSLGSAPYFWEVSAGIGHEFISASGHSAFFELGGGLAKLTTKLTNERENSPLGGIFKVSIGYRYYF